MHRIAGGASYFTKLTRRELRAPEMRPSLARIFDARGIDRCLWGTDWTRTYAVLSYGEAVQPFLKTDRLSDSERAMLMGGACIKAYRWSPKKVTVRQTLTGG